MPKKPKPSTTIARQRRLARGRPLQGAKFDAMVHDVTARGFLKLIELYDGMVLDGWSRRRAARISGIDCPGVAYDWDDPAGHVVRGAYEGGRPGLNEPRVYDTWDKGAYERRRKK